MISYFDDFGALLPANIAQRGLDTFSEWCSLLGIGPRLKKSEVGSNITFLGLAGSFPTVEVGGKLRVSLPHEER